MNMETNNNNTDNQIKDAATISAETKSQNNDNYSNQNQHHLTATVCDKHQDAHKNTTTSPFTEEEKESPEQRTLRNASTTVPLLSSDPLKNISDTHMKSSSLAVRCSSSD